MTLPIKQPFPPMEALSVKEIPAGNGWQYEPKWDGFRCLAFRDGKKIHLQSKSGQSLDRYFPEIVSALLKLKANKFVLDGELVVPLKTGFSFDDLLMRIHPAASRIQKLSLETPARFIVFDLLVDDNGKPIFQFPLAQRRKRLDSFARKYLRKKTRVDLSPATEDVSLARQWLSSAGIKLDGVIAKRLELPYQLGERTGMRKVKKLRTADCVVGGFRYGTNTRLVASLLLGLYDEQGLLHHVGFTSSFNAAQRSDLTKKLVPLIKPPGFTGNKPGGPSRWSTERSGDWHPLAPKLVVEVQFDHFTGGRFRHGTKFLRWRPDKKVRGCTFHQLK